MRGSHPGLVPGAAMTGQLPGAAGLHFLGSMTELRILDMTRTGITDEGLKYLAQLTNLQSLRLEETQVKRSRSENERARKRKKKSVS